MLQCVSDCVRRQRCTVLRVQASRLPACPQRPQPNTSPYAAQCRMPLPHPLQTGSCAAHTHSGSSTTNTSSSQHTVRPCMRTGACRDLHPRCLSKRMPSKQNAGREGAHWPGTAPAHSQAVAVDGQVGPARRQQRELGDHLLGELRQHTCAQGKGRGTQSWPCCQSGPSVAHL